MSEQGKSLVEIREDIADKLTHLFYRIAYDNYTPRFVCARGGRENISEITLERDNGYLGPNRNIDLFMMPSPYPHAILRYTFFEQDKALSRDEEIVMGSDYDISLVMEFPETRVEMKTSVKIPALVKANGSQRTFNGLVSVVNKLVSLRNYEFITADEIISDIGHLRRFAAMANTFLDWLTDSHWRRMSYTHSQNYTQHLGKTIKHTPKQLLELLGNFEK